MLMLIFRSKILSSDQETTTTRREINYWEKLIEVGEQHGTDTTVTLVPRCFGFDAELPDDRSADINAAVEHVRKIINYDMV